MKRFNITGYPTLFFYKEGVNTTFSAGRSDQEIVKKLFDELGHYTLVLNSAAALNEFAD